MRNKLAGFDIMKIGAGTTGVNKIAGAVGFVQINGQECARFVHWVSAFPLSLWSGTQDLWKRKTGGVKAEKARICILQVRILVFAKCIL